MVRVIKLSMKCTLIRAFRGRHGRKMWKDSAEGAKGSSGPWPSLARGSCELPTASVSTPVSSVVEPLPWWGWRGMREAMDNQRGSWGEENHMSLLWPRHSRQQAFWTRQGAFCPLRTCRSEQPPWPLSGLIPRTRLLASTAHPALLHAASCRSPSSSGICFLSLKNKITRRVRENPSL